MAVYRIEQTVTNVAIVEAESAQAAIDSLLNDLDPEYTIEACTYEIFDKETGDAVENWEIK